MPGASFSISFTPELPAGAGYSYAAVASYANLPASAPAGSVCKTTDTGWTWVYDGSDWLARAGTVSSYEDLPTADVEGQAWFTVITPDGGGADTPVLYVWSGSSWIRYTQTIASADTWNSLVTGYTAATLNPQDGDIARLLGENSGNAPLPSTDVFHVSEAIWHDGAWHLQRGLFASVSTFDEWRSERSADISNRAPLILIGTAGDWADYAFSGEPGYLYRFKDWTQYFAGAWDQFDAPTGLDVGAEGDLGVYVEGTWLDNPGDLAAWMIRDAAGYWLGTRLYCTGQVTDLPTTNLVNGAVAVCDWTSTPITELDRNAGMFAGARPTHRWDGTVWSPLGGAKPEVEVMVGLSTWATQGQVFVVDGANFALLSMTEVESPEQPLNDFLLSGHYYVSAEV